MKKLLTFVVLALAGLSLRAQQFTAPPALSDSLQALLQRAHIPGLSLAIVQNGALAFHGTYGLRSLDTGLPIEAETVFAAASLSKPLFAYAALQLVEEGKLHLDRPLCEYFPYDDLAHDNRYRKITARMVLSHTAGLPNWRRGQLELIDEPGNAFHYSGEGFVFLMKTVEQITGMDMNRFVHQRAFEPLGMTHASYCWEERFEKNFALPHGLLGRTETKYRPREGNAAHSLQVAAQDYARFLAALLEKGKGGLGEEMLQQMLQPQVVIDSSEALGGKVSWGLGIGLEDSAFGKAFWHWGDNNTFKCFMIGFPERRLGLVYFTNSQLGLSIAPELLQLCLGSNFPSVRWIDYAHYNHPSNQLLPEVLRRGFDIAITPFMDVKGQHQDTSLIGEWHMNQLGYQLLRMGRLEDARQAFWMNMLAFPNAANPVDSYAEACLRSGMQQKAQKYYARAAEMDPTNHMAAGIAQRLADKTNQKGILFELKAYPFARHVALAGSFNNWNRLSVPMHWQDGRWACRINLENGTYPYQFIVDGIRIPDPDNPSMSNDGQHHSLITVE